MESRAGILVAGGLEKRLFPDLRTVFQYFNRQHCHTRSTSVLRERLIKKRQKQMRAKGEEGVQMAREVSWVMGR